MTEPNNWRKAFLWMGIALVLFIWADIIHGFLNLEKFTQTSAKVVSVNDLDKVYWSSIEVGTALCEGYFHTEPEIGNMYSMITSDGKVYYDYVDRIVFIDGSLSRSGGILVLNLTTHSSISYLNSIVVGSGWALLIYGIITYTKHKRRLTHA